MYKITLLLFAGSMLTFLAVAHSYLGERYLFARLFDLPDLPLFRKDRKYTECVIRFAWHITGISWIGFAALLFLAAFYRYDLIVPAIAIIVAVHGIGIVATCGRRHPAWALFLLAAVMITSSVWF